MSTFPRLFDRPPTATSSAPGRVNLIGEHTDYNDGFMLPMIIPYETTAEIAPTEGRLVRAASGNVGDASAISSFELGTETRRHAWIDYVQGVTATLRESGYQLRGFDLFVTSTIPLGSGLSSSAALLVAVLRALREAFAFDVDDKALATLAQRAEVEFVRVPVGIMDQMVCSMGRPEHALLIDAQTLELTHVKLPPAAEIVVIDSNIRHRHASGQYRTRRGECEQACAALGIDSLRRLTVADIGAGRLSGLSAPLVRRVRHVVTENARVLAVAEALPAGDLRTSGRILREGHASLRNDYEVSTPEIDRLVALLDGQPGVFGARLTGGGFGGSIVGIAATGHGRAAADTVIEEYARATGATATVILPAPDHQAPRSSGASGGASS